MPSGKGTYGSKVGRPKMSAIAGKAKKGSKHATYKGGPPMNKKTKKGKK